MKNTETGRYVKLPRFGHYLYNSAAWLCESGGIGRRAGFRCQWGNP